MPQIQTQIQTETENIIDTSVLDEMIRWIKALTAVGVSPDAAANVTSKFFIATFAADEDEGDDEEYYEE